MPLMGIPSLPELLIIAVVVLVLFGGKKLPELGGAIGESIKNFKKGIKDDEGETRRLADAARAAEVTKTVETKVETTVGTDPKDGPKTF